MGESMVCIFVSEKGERKMGKRNPIAKNLRTPLYRKRVMKSKKVYNRKNQKLEVRGGG
ncbi:hypothetical protein UFOVP395_13 [uncultured Caudovirales phage]|jgi:hypothetical protein|uniref:Uncharacterized protein n=1 Tax=uncultured Caudovirales phage TaxID=2100421 RepID=A0A6J5M0T2_9CAUD|nr:hypothetical protein UFOVP395_13 [uncultured Caudovirales phage]